MYPLLRAERPESPRDDPESPERDCPESPESPRDLLESPRDDLRPAFLEEPYGQPAWAEAMRRVVAKAFIVK